MSTVYAPTILAEAGLVSYWRFGESSGTVAADSKGANPGTYKGTPTLGVTGSIVGDPNSAITGNGTTQYISVPDSTALDLGDVFTYEAWIKRSGTGLTDSIIDKGPQGPILRFDGEDHLLLRRNSVGDITKSTVKITDTIWHHVVATKNGATVKLYVDGVDVTGAITNQTCLSTNFPLTIGADEGGPEDFFRGSIDEVAVYSVALTAAQTLDHYQKGAAAAIRRSLLGAGR